MQKMTLKIEIDRLLVVGFIYQVEYTEWASPIVIVPESPNIFVRCGTSMKVDCPRNHGMVANVAKEPQEYGVIFQMGT